MSKRISHEDIFDDDFDFEEGYDYGDNDSLYPDDRSRVYLKTENTKEFVVIEENRTDNVNRFDITNYLIEIEDRYPDLKKFKYKGKFDLTNSMCKVIDTLILQNKDRVFDVIYDDSIFFKKRENLSLISFTLILDDFAIVYKHNIFHRTRSLIYFNDWGKTFNILNPKDVYNYSVDCYQLTEENNHYVLTPFKVDHAEDPIFSEDIEQKLKDDVKLFFENKEFYVKNNLPYKRGLLLYGNPGTGKTMLVKKIINDYKDCYRILIDCAKDFDSKIYEFIDNVLPKHINKIIIFEDVESITGQDNYRRSSFLNFIDGAKSLENVFYIATTNNPHLVDPAIINRPSRFDRLYNIGNPKPDARKRLLFKYFPELKDNEKLTEYVKLTEEFSGAYFKELYLLVGIQKCTIKEAIEDLQKRNKLCKENNFVDKKQRFGI